MLQKQLLRNLVDYNDQPCVHFLLFLLILFVCF